MDLHDDVKYTLALAPVAAITNDTAMVSAIIDTANFVNTELVLITGTLTDADAAFTVLIEDGDNSALSDAAAVADANLLGTEALAGFTFANDNVTKKIGYIGAKRYVRATVTPTNNTGNFFLAAVWAQGGARKSPQS